MNPDCPARAVWETLAELGLLKCAVKDRPRRPLYDEPEREAAFRRWQHYADRCPITYDELRDTA